MKNTISKILNGIASDIDSGRYDISDNDVLDFILMLKQFIHSDIPMSKYSACKYLNISRSSFDSLVRDGKIPRGKHRIGFKELEWTRLDLDKYIADKNRYK